MTFLITCLHGESYHLLEGSFTQGNSQGLAGCESHLAPWAQSQIIPLTLAPEFGLGTAAAFL